MPIYCYRCPECGKAEEIVKPMREAGQEEYCKHCSRSDDEPIFMNRDFGSEKKGVVGTEKGDTFWSQSLAISPSQFAEHRRMFPNVRLRSDGCPGFDSVKERSDYCDRTGFYKVPGKQKRRMTKLPVRPQPTPATRASLEKDNGQADRNGEKHQSEQAGTGK
jgi:putative FmdB family regulatory protein